MLKNPRLEISRKEKGPDASEGDPEPLNPSIITLQADVEPSVVNSDLKATEEEERGECPEEEEETDSIDAKIAASRRPLSSNSCLFCPHQSSSVELSLEHMTRQHSFFIPDIDYLRDTEGLLACLGEKVVIKNICLYCNSRSREFRSKDAVWKHMTDKSHCKIAYDSQKDRLEISDFYDFSSSYPDAAKQASRSRQKPSVAVIKESEDNDDSDGDWEDVEDDGTEEATSNEEEEVEELPRSQITYGDSEYELVLPSGARIGHRSLQRYYAQSFSSYRPVTENPNSGAAIVRRLLTDKRSDLIPAKGGFGAFGSGTQVIKARNRGEAREAGRHIREFRDQKRKEDYKTRVAFVHNHQKHFRDPLLQVRLG